MPLRNISAPALESSDEGCYMNKNMLIIERFAPDALEIIETRYRILRHVSYHQPVGRRQLTKELNYTERTVRSEIEKLRQQGAIYSTPAGLYITLSGKEMLQEVSQVIPVILSIQPLIDAIKQEYNLREAIIVPGDSNEEPMSKKDLGRAAAAYLQRILKPGNVMAVTGGSTLAEMAAAMETNTRMNNVLVLPARGGLGEGLEEQAGTIAANIAAAIGAQYRLLHIPDYLEEQTAEVLKRDTHIQDLINLIKGSHILVHGIGPAMEMATRRGLSADIIDLLRKKNAVAEAYRYYFDKKGNIIYEVPGIGLEMSDFNNIETVVAVAGSQNKAEAIKAVLNHGKINVLITDEGAAREIARLTN